MDKLLFLLMVGMVMVGCTRSLSEDEIRVIVLKEVSAAISQVKQGPQGERGPQGLAGSQGPAGTATLAPNDERRLKDLESNVSRLQLKLGMVSPFSATFPSVSDELRELRRCVSFLESDVDALRYRVENGKWFLFFRGNNCRP